MNVHGKSRPLASIKRLPAGNDLRPKDPIAFETVVLGPRSDVISLDNFSFYCCIHSTIVIVVETDAIYQWLVILDSKSQWLASQNIDGDFFQIIANQFLRFCWPLVVL